MTYADASRLFRQGRFREIIDGFKRLGSSGTTDRQLSLLVAYVLALTDDTVAAAQLLNVDTNALAPTHRAQAAMTSGIISWRSGDHESALHQLQSAVRIAREAQVPHLFGWACLHLFRCSIEVQTRDVVLGMLRDVRTAVTRAGDVGLSSYLHVCVAVFEGQRGQLDEAMRHCDIAESLLDSSPNAWILGAALLNRSCVACLQCDFTRAADYARRVIALANVTGLLIQRGAAEIMSGYLQLLAGDFQKAEQTLTNLVSDSDFKHSTSPAADLLARVYLAGGDLNKCERTLRLVQLSHEETGLEQLAYGARWAALTKAKLFMKHRDFHAALSWLQALETGSVNLDDRPFKGTVDLLTAQSFHKLGRGQECARKMIRADHYGIRRSRDSQGQFQHSAAVIAADENPLLAHHLRERASRIWSSQGIVALRLEIDDSASPSVEPVLSADEPTGAGLTKTAINCVGAAFDLSETPRLLGEELRRVIDLSGCSTNAAVVETADTAHEPFDRSGRRMVLRLGDAPHTGRSWALTCDVPASPSDAIVLTDVFRIGRAAIALEKARQDERRRAALWPSEPIEEQAGALFLAEAMQDLLDTARRVAAANIPVLITGETGTGKEVLARLIHGYSPRSTKTFLPFNCSATPRDMLDAQLFGHRKGAFTGASENFPGVIRAAAGGTLFLDEIGESTLDIQPKLLRFLESGEVHPIGDTHPQRVDVRILAATNADVDALVAQGRFREDLFYRLNIIRLRIPPLRERRVEIPSFANHYLQKYAKEMSKGELRLSEETMEYLVLFRWPGNVRQIANEMRRLAALAEPGAVLMPEHLSADIAASRRTVPASPRALDTNEVMVRTDQSLAAAVHHLEHTMVQAAMAKTSSVDEAAKLLGLSRKGLYLKRLRFGMEIDRPKGDAEVA